MFHALRLHWALRALEYLHRNADLGVRVECLVFRVWGVGSGVQVQSSGVCGVGREAVSAGELSVEGWSLEARSAGGPMAEGAGCRV